MKQPLKAKMTEDKLKNKPTYTQAKQKVNMQETWRVSGGDQVTPDNIVWLNSPGGGTGGEVYRPRLHIVAKAVDMPNYSKSKKMQSETTDFAIGAAASQTGRKILVVFDSGPFALLYV